MNRGPGFFSFCGRGPTPNSIIVKLKWWNKIKNKIKIIIYSFENFKPLNNQVNSPFSLGQGSPEDHTHVFSSHRQTRAQQQLELLRAFLD